MSNTDLYQSRYPDPSDEDQGEGGEDARPNFDGMVIELWTVIAAPLLADGVTPAWEPPIHECHSALIIFGDCCPVGRRQHLVREVLEWARLRADELVDEGAIAGDDRSRLSFLAPLLAQCIVSAREVSGPYPITFQALPEQVVTIRPTPDSVRLRLVTRENNAWGTWWLEWLRADDGEVLAIETLGVAPPEPSAAQRTQPLGGITASDLPASRDALPIPRVLEWAQIATADQEQQWQAELAAFKARYASPEYEH